MSMKLNEFIAICQQDLNNLKSRRFVDKYRHFAALRWQDSLLYRPEKKLWWLRDEKPGDILGEDIDIVFCGKYWTKPDIAKRYWHSCMGSIPDCVERKILWISSAYHVDKITENILENIDDFDFLTFSLQLRLL